MHITTINSISNLIKLWTLITALAFCTSCSPVPSYANARTFMGTVTYILDGDTITVKEHNNSYAYDNTYHRIRLASIDAPEKDQPYGPQAATLLRNLIINKTVLVSVQDTDKYGREVAHIYFDNQEISSLMLASGAAWHLSYFDRNSPRYQLHYELEQKAKREKRGLWAKPNPVAPWLWRK